LLFEFGLKENLKRTHSLGTENKSKSYPKTAAIFTVENYLIFF